MKKCKEFKFILNEIIDIVIIAIITVIIQFLLGFKSGNFLSSLVCGINTSVYSQLKTISCALYLTSFVKMWIDENRKDNLWTSLFFKIIVATLILATITRVYKLYFVETIIIDIVLNCISIIISQIIEIIIQKYIRITSNIEEVFKYLNILLVLLIGISFVIGGI